MKLWKKLAAATALTVVGAGAMAAELYTPNLAYRTGPFAALGIPLMNGQADYMTLLNERDGGIGGLPVNFEECETGYSTEKGVECYEKTKGGALVTQPWSTGITLQVLPKTNVDQIPILAPGYGFSPMSEGGTFQWAYNPPASYWDGAYMILADIAGGDMANLKGKKIAFLHLDHPFGKEPLPLLEQMAAEHGFELVPIPVGLKEMQNQSAQWLQVRRERPDNVIMWGWGAMNSAAIAEAVKTKYPMDQFYGVWWAGHDPDLAAVGAEGKGYKSISWSMPQPDSALMAEIKEKVIASGKTQTTEDQLNSVFYQRGLVMSMILAEGIKAAQAHTGTSEITPADLRWGLENLDITEEKLAELGMAGMVPPFATSCDNHTGHSGGWILEWDGEKFVQASDLLQADQSVIEALAEAKAAEYAEANAPWPVNESCGG